MRITLPPGPAAYHSFEHAPSRVCMYAAISACRQTAATSDRQQACNCRRSHILDLGLHVHTCGRGSRLRPGLRPEMRAALRTMTRAQELSPRKPKCLRRPPCLHSPHAQPNPHLDSLAKRGALSERVQSLAQPAEAAFALVWCAWGCSASSGVIGVICRVSTCARCALVSWCVVQA